MLRRTAPRVCWLWILLSSVLIWRVHCASAQSCHEVKTAFQLRQVGSLRLVPETAATDADLLICKHQGPTCCTRKMEESYYAAAQRDTLQNILSYSFELKYLILGHASSFQDTFYSLLSFTLNHTYSLFDSTYETISKDVKPLVSTLFSDLDLYLRGDANISVDHSVHSFYDKLFPLVYQHLVNPGLGSNVSTWSSEGSDCLRATRRDINPFGPHPQELAQGLSRALVAGHALSQALAVGAEVLNATESVGMVRQCGRALVQMLFCPHCRGLTLIRPCGGLCLNVMRGCLAGLAELDGPWRRYVALLEGLSGALAGGYEVELALLRIRERINDAILTAQLHGPHLSAVVGKVCGSLTEPVSSTPVSPTSRSLSPSLHPTIELQTSVTSSSPTTLPDTGNQHEHITLKRRSLPLKPSKNDKPRSLKKISKEFMGYIQRYKSFFSMLPEMLCEGEVVMDENTCWSGEDVVESYTGHVVGNGLQAQRHNPEIKVRSAHPILVNVKEKLERFNQEMWGEMGLGTDGREDVETSSGDAAEGSGECDDEDGCQGSGRGEDETVLTKKEVHVRIPPREAIIPIQPPNSRPKLGAHNSGVVHIPTISSVLFLQLLLLIQLLLWPGGF
ncbi:glypican-5-like [Sinocyclocheilus anshuiensis]|uniref:Glypican-5-like n=1 Tax=Sinocyclocheilus anshuiensis TaxID=1608454 RepID=A0A671SQ92_9TELE|nr:PREDICTED: glypican-5-like [Sinocyclocheilus anshuiensis]